MHARTRRPRWRRGVAANHPGDRAAAANRAWPGRSTTLSGIRTVSAARKVERVRAIATTLQRNLDDAIAIRAMFDRANNDPALHDAYRKTYAAHGCNLVRSTLFMQLALTLVRMHDPPGRDRGSLPQVFALLKDRHVMAEIREEARHWPPDASGMAYDSEEAAVEAIRTARKKWRAINRGKPLKRLREHRHRYLAHTLVEMPETESPMINDVYKLFDGTKPIVTNVVHGVLGLVLDPEGVSRIRWKYADEFWSRAIAGMAASRDR